jgi:ABC-type phosphate transport system permease subunit
VTERDLDAYVNSKLSTFFGTVVVPLIAVIIAVIVVAAIALAFVLYLLRNKDRTPITPDPAQTPFLP